MDPVAMMHFRKSNPGPLNDGAAFYLLMSLAICRLLAGFVAKVEKRTTPKISPTPAAPKP